MTAAVPSAARAAQTTVAEERRATSITAFGNIAVWSRFRPSERRFVLVLSDNGVVRELDTGSREVPFDVDLGPGPGGRPQLVFSRCATEGEGVEEYGGLPLWVRGRGCDLMLHDLQSGRTRRLRGVSSDVGSEVLPTIWGSRIGFARTYPGRRGIAGALPHLYVGSVNGSARSRAVGPGPRGRYRSFDLGLSGPGPLSLDLRGQKLAFAWRHAVRNCPRNESDGESGGPEGRAGIFVGAPGSSTRAVEQGTPCGPGGLVGASLAAATLTFTRQSGRPDGASAFVTRSLRDGGTRTVPTTARVISSSAGNATLWAIEATATGWAVVRRDLGARGGQ